jgi:ABC-type phosphate transport system permease subunit
MGGASKARIIWSVVLIPAALPLTLVSILLSRHFLVGRTH